MLVETLLFDLFHERIENGARAGRDTAGRHADDDANLVMPFAQRNLTLHLVADFCKFLQ